ncbi:MAG: type II toxin-antitoxin system VapC family toxin [Candidatus Acidiferrales bacterium]
MSTVFWDTNVFIYFLEGSGEAAHRTKLLRQRMQERRDQLCSSTFSLGEVLVKPAEERNWSLADRYESVFRTQLRLIPFDTQVARHYAQIRADRSIRAPDAIQLASAAHAGVDLFVTDDAHLSKKVIRGVGFIVSVETALSVL